MEGYIALSDLGVLIFALYGIAKCDTSLLLVFSSYLWLDSGCLVVYKP